MIAHLLTSHLSVYRPILEPDGFGGQIVADIVDVGEISAQVNQPTAEERAVAHQLGANLSHIVHTVAHADVQRGDLLYGELPSDVIDGNALRVISVISNSRSTYRRLACEITQAEPGEVGST